MSNMLAALKGAALSSTMSAEEYNRVFNEALGDVTKGGGNGITYLYLSGKTGDMGFGKDREPVDPDDEFLLALDATRKGWLCWAGGAVKGRHSWPITRVDLAVPSSELEDHGPYNVKVGEGWKQALIIQFVGEDGVEYEYEASAVSACNAIADMTKLANSRRVMGDPHLPVFKLSKKQFVAQSTTNWKPVFTIVDWLTEDEALERYADKISKRQSMGGAAASPSKEDREADAEYGDAEPVKAAPSRRARKAAPEEVEDAVMVEDEAPAPAPRARRRRRPAA